MNNLSPLQKPDLTKIFESFKQIKALIIGDVMIDSYLWGEVTRISPEAPVPIVNVKKREKRLGGAANVAVNIQAMGAEPVMCSVIGYDADAEDFLKILENRQMTSAGIIRSKQRVTTIKHRILSGHQHILRVDSEISSLLHETDREALWKKIQNLLPQCQVVIFEDYDKGVLDKIIINQTITLAQSLNIPTIVDPKLRNFLHYEGASLFKPNLKELKEGLKVDFSPDNLDELKQTVKILKEKLQIEQALVTLSERGVYIDSKTEQYHLPAHLRSIADVSGAGDTVVSVAALGLALGLKPKILAGLANLAGGLVCEYVGVVPIERDKLLREALKLQEEWV
jgi:D-glycero-beta-D-manno-heptose-7-phosphate kinase